MNVETLLGKEWAAILPKAEELLTPVAEQLRLEKAHGITVLPLNGNTFRIFHDIPPEKVKVLWLGQDPYPNPPLMATGRAFECGAHPTASWRKISEIYKKEIEDPSEAVVRGELSTWVDQGVFLLNKALTVRHRMPGSHTRFWEPFTRYVVGVMLSSLDPKAVILLGAEAQKMIPRVPAPHKGFLYEHPAAASYQGRSWNANGLFIEVNKFLTFHNKAINW